MRVLHLTAHSASQGWFSPHAAVIVSRRIGAIPAAHISYGFAV